MALDVDPEIAKVAEPWIDKLLTAALKSLFERGCAEIPGMKEKDVQRILEYSLAYMIKAWGERRAMMVQYSKIFDNMPFIGSPADSSMFGLMENEIKHFKLNYPLQSIGFHIEPPKPLECSICGKTACAHLQTIFNSMRVADSDEGGVIDALLEDADGTGRPEGDDEDGG